MFYVCFFKNSFTLQNIMFFNKKICTKICKKVCIKVCMNYKKKGEVLPSIPFVWCGWWDVQSSVNLTPLTGQQRRAPAKRCGFQTQRVCCAKHKVPPTKKRPEGLFSAAGGTCSQVLTWLRWRTSEDGRQPHSVGSKRRAFVVQSTKVPPTKKDLKVFLVRPEQPQLNIILHCRCQIVFSLYLKH